MSEALSQPAGDIAEDKAPGQTETSGQVSDRVPRVSIGLPVYNGENFLEQALDSLLAQTFGDFELIISDNGSTDRTQQICRNYAARDNRIRYFRNETNRGASWNFNNVFSLARGEYFKWAAHDDVCAPEFLEVCVSVLDREPEVVLCYGWTQMVDLEGRELENMYPTPKISNMDSSRPYQRFHGAIFPDHWCFEVFGLIRRAVLRQTALIANYAGSDRVLLADLTLQGRFHEVPARLFFNRNHPSRSIQKHSVYTVAVWYDPKTKIRVTFPYWRYLWEYGRAVAHSELDGQERVRCYAQLFLWMGQYAKQLAADFRRAGMTLLLVISPKTGELISRVVHEGPHVLFGPRNRVQGEKSKRKA